MSNEKTTLADAQPGGRVRLGDGLPPLPKMQRFTNLYGETYAYSAEQMREYARAALSAQPSPGGQGDALDCIGRIEEAIEFRVPHDIYAAVHGELAELKAALAARHPVDDQHPDDLAVDAFAAAMKAKMAEGRAKGRGGWNDPEQCTAEDLSRMLRDHVDKGDPRDVANFCMMLHQRGEAIAVRQPVDENYEIWAQNAENVAAELTDERAIKALRFAARGIRSAARHPVRIYGCCAQPEGELHTADCPNMRHLVARQPVGQIPAGFVLVPEKFGIPAEVWEGVEFVIGGPGTGEGEAYLDSTAWVGDLIQDDGSAVYGLHLSCDECPEEGSVTLSEFTARAEVQS